MKLTPKLYVKYLEQTYEVLKENEEYVTNLDLATGDGDHWANMNMGFEKLMTMTSELETLNFGAMFKRIGMTMMSVIGGSSGVLYGGAYIAASKALGEKEILEDQDILFMWETMMADMIKRGKTEPGWKTMIDTLYVTVEQMKKDIADGKSSEVIFENVKLAAEKGAESTRNMEAVRGRASYQADKGVGHLDPGAVTMAYQITTLAKVVEG